MRADTPVQGSPARFWVRVNSRAGRWSVACRDEPERFGDAA